MCPPMRSLVQPSRWAWQMASRSVWVPSLYFQWSHLLSLFGWRYFPRLMPEHLLSLMSQSSMIQLLDQCGPIMPSW